MNNQSKLISVFLFIAIHITSLSARANIHKETEQNNDPSLIDVELETISNNPDQQAYFTIKKKYALSIYIQNLNRIYTDLL